MIKKMVKNSRELALRRASTLPKKIGLRRWASGGSARLALRALKVLTSRQILPEPLVLPSARKPPREHSKSN